MIAQPKSVRSIELRARTRYTAHPMRDQVISERGKGEAVGRVVRSNAALSLATYHDASGHDQLVSMLEPMVVSAPVAGKIFAAAMPGEKDNLFSGQSPYVVGIRGTAPWCFDLYVLFVFEAGHRVQPASSDDADGWFHS